MRTALLPAGMNEPRGLLPPPTHEPRVVDAEALAGMAIVRKFRMADMCNREQVITLIDAFGFGAGADWLRRNRHLYFLALRQLDR